MSDWMTVELAGGLFIAAILACVYWPVKHGPRDELDQPEDEHSKTKNMGKM